MIHRKAVIGAVVLFILIVVGMFIFAYLKRGEVAEPVVDEQQQQEEEPSGPYGHIDRIDAKHFYSDGTHTLAGEIAMPTPCDLLDPSVTVAESFPEQVTVEFNVVNESDMCAQVITPQRFKVEFDASENASISARLDGRTVELNLLQPDEGETPEDFELFIKG